MEHLQVLSKEALAAELQTFAPDQLFKISETTYKSDPEIADSCLVIFFRSVEDSHPDYYNALLIRSDLLSQTDPFASLSSLISIVKHRPNLQSFCLPIVKKIITFHKTPEIFTKFSDLISASIGLWQVIYLNLLAETQEDKEAIEIYNTMWEVIFSLGLAPSEISNIIKGDNDLLPVDCEILKSSEKPSQVYSSKLVETWWTCEGKEMRGYVCVALMMNEFRSCLEKSVTADIVAIVLSLGLSNALGVNLAQAGTQFTIEALDNCFEVKVSGHSSKVLDSLEKIMEFLYNSAPTSEDLERAISILKAQYQNMNTELLNQSRQLRLAFLQHQQYLYTHKLEYLSNINPYELNLSHVKVLMYTAGNISAEQAVGISEFVEGLLFAVEGKKLKYLSPRTITLLPEGVVELSQSSHSENNLDSVVEIYFQLGQASIEERVLASLLENILRKGVHELLQKSCKSVTFSSRMTRGVSGVLIKAISEEMHPAAIQEIIFSQVKSLHQNIENYFEITKAELSLLKNQEFQSFQDKTSFYWDEILQGNIEFERQRKEILYLENLLFSQFNEWLSQNKFLRKCLVVKIISQKWGPVNDPLSEEMLSDIEAFRGKYSCYSWLRIMH